jgi:putative transposase
MMYPLVRDLAAAGAPVRVPVAVTCRVLNLARQPYYRWLANPIMSSELEEAYRANALFDAHRDDPEFGYRFLVDEARDAGEPMAPRTAWRICSDNGWWSAFGKPKRGKAGKPGPPVHDDLLAVVDEKGRVRHEFTADGPNEVWLTDLTEHRTDEGKLYLCAIKDVYSNRIVGYAIDSRMKSRLAVAALESAVARRGEEVAGCIVQSDRGSQFRSRKFVRALNRHHLVGSMGRVGADDNASGVAVTLEVARQLRGRDHRVVIALVDLEELWHLGSRELARTLPRPGLVVCLDAVGFFDERPWTQRLPAGLGLRFPALARQLRMNEHRGNFLLAVHRRSSAAFTTCWARAATAAGLPAAQLRDPRWNGRGQRITHWVNPLLMDLDRSGHEPFWRRGIPAVLLTGTATLRSPHYHRDSDTPDTLDYARLAQVGLAERR